MKKLISLSFVLFAGIISCTAQKSQDRPVSSFQRLKLSGSVNVVYTSSDSLALKVEADEKEIDNVETKVENGTLFIENKGNFRSPVTVYVKNGQLSSIEAGGATNLKTTNSLKGENLELSASGSAHVELNIEAARLDCQQSGASSLVLKGKSGDMNLTMSGASSFKGYGLSAGTASVSTTGASSAKVFVTDRLRASAGGASSVKVKGDPRELNAEATPAATISKAGKQASNESSGDTVTYNWNTRKIIVVTDLERMEELKQKKKHYDNDDFKHWSGFAMGVNGYFNNNGGTNMTKNYKYMELDYSRSLNFQFNIFEHQFNLAKNYVKLVTGLGFDYHIYALGNKTNLNADSSFTWGRIDSTNQYDYKKNRLRCTYLQVPLLLEFNTSKNPSRTFHVALGVVGEFLIAARTKQVLEQDKAEITRIRKDNYNLTPFVAKAHVNFGYRGWTFFGEYNLTPLFESGRGPELYPFTAGIRLIPFS